MDQIITLIPLSSLLVSLCVGLVAGIVKGMVGFAMPMIMISGLGSFVAPELALAGLILPTVVTNGWQALRQGRAAAWETTVRFKSFLLIGLVALVVSSQLVRVLPERLMLLMIGIPIVIFAITQLMGKVLTLGASPSPWIERAVAGVAGFIGGFSGVWGPPTVAYLTAMNVPKQEHVRAQGVIYGLGAVALFGAHIASGVVNRDTLPFSALLVVPALVGMWIGFKVQDRIDQAAFKKATLVVLLVAGGNLVRRGLF